MVALDTNDKLYYNFKEYRLYANYNYLIVLNNYINNVKLFIIN